MLSSKNLVFVEMTVAKASRLAVFPETLEKRQLIDRYGPYLPDHGFLSSTWVVEGWRSFSREADKAALPSWPSWASGPRSCDQMSTIWDWVLVLRQECESWDIMLVKTGKNWSLASEGLRDIVTYWYFCIKGTEGGQWRNASYIWSLS